jgi:hypothetical protein
MATAISLPCGNSATLDGCGLVNPRKQITGGWQRTDRRALVVGSALQRAKNRSSLFDQRAYSGDDAVTVRIRINFDEAGKEARR